MEIQTKSSTTKAGRPPSLVLIDEQLWRNRRVARMATRTVKEHRCGTPMVSLWEKTSTKLVGCPHRTVSLQEGNWLVVIFKC